MNTGTGRGRRVYSISGQVQALDNEQSMLEKKDRDRLLML